MPVDGKLQAVQIVQHQGMTMLAPVVTGLPGLNSSSGAAPGSMAPPSSSKAPIFGQSAKINIDTASLLPSKQTTTSSVTPPGTSPLVTNSIQSNSFAALAQVPGSSASGGEQKTVQPSGNSGNESLEVTAVSPGNAKSPTKGQGGDKTTDIDALKKKLALMERETTRLREMHKARLKKLETKQRAQEELRKRDAEIQRVREPEARTPFNNYRKHIAGLLYRNIRQDEEDARTVYVRNLHPKINEQQLREHFSMFGAIKRIVLPQDAHQIGSNRGFTFITFASKEPVEVACSLDGTLLHERSIKVVPKTNMMGKIRPQHLVH